MGKVSWQSIHSIAKAVSQLKNDSIEEILSSLPSSSQGPLNPKGFLDWSHFVDWMEALDSKYQPLQWREVGELVVQRKTSPALNAVARMTFSVRSAYWIGAKWFGPSQFTATRCIFEDLGPNQIRETLILAEGCKACRLVFEMFEGSLAAAPRVAFGLPPSQVKAQISGSRAIYDITFPVHYKLWTKAKIFLSSLFSFRSLLRELAVQQTILQNQARALEMERLEFKNLIEQFPHGILIHRDGIIRYINHKLADYVLEQDAQSAVGKSVLDYIHPKDRQSVQQRLAMGPGRFYKPQEIALQTAHSLKPLSCDYTPIPVNFEGEPATAVVIRDLTEQKNLQAHLMLSDRMRALGQLAAGIGHEINNPMFFVMMKTEKLSQHLQAQNDPTALQMVEDLHEGLGRINDIVKQLKAFSRGHEDSPVQVDTIKVMKSSIQIAQNIISLRAQLRIFMDRVPSVLANEAHLGQVFLNLLINAAQAIESGNPQDNRIEVRIRNHDSATVSIEITDTGIGIPESARPQVFQPFYTTKAIGEGTGLGLSISHSIVARYKGSLDFKSEPGKGTTFQILLPAAPQTIEMCEAPEIEEFSLQTMGRVLLVDDDESLLEILESVTSSYFETTALSDAQQALHKIRSGEDYDCIVCDLMMPGLDGQEFYQQLKLLRPDLCRKILFLTGGSYSKQHDDFLNLPGIHYLEKPIESARLLNQIQSTILEEGQELDQRHTML